MNYLIGKAKRGIVLDFNVLLNGSGYPIKDMQRSGSGAIDNQSMSHIFGSWESGEIPNLSKCTLAYSDITNKCFINLTRNLSYPRVRIYSKLPNSGAFAVDSFFIEDNLKVESVKVLSANKEIAGDKVNDAMLRNAKVNLWEKLFFERVGDPLVSKQIKNFSIGNIEIHKKKLVGIEI